MSRKIRMILFNDDGSVLEQRDSPPLPDHVKGIEDALKEVSRGYHQRELDILQTATRVLHMRLTEVVKAVQDLQAVALDPHNEPFISKVLNDVNLRAAVAILNEVPLVTCVDMTKTYGHQEHTLIGDWFYEQQRRRR